MGKNIFDRTISDPDTRIEFSFGCCLLQAIMEFATGLALCGISIAASECIAAIRGAIQHGNSSAILYREDVRQFRVGILLLVGVLLIAAIFLAWWTFCSSGFARIYDISKEDKNMFASSMIKFFIIIMILNTFYISLFSNTGYQLSGLFAEVIRCLRATLAGAIGIFLVFTIAKIHAKIRIKISKISADNN